jgi:cytochrome c oxidase assembly protein subunit 15
MIDKVALAMGDATRNKWVENVGGKFQLHALFSLIVLGLNLFLVFRIKKNIDQKGIIYKFSLWLLVLILIEMLSGIILGYLGFPAFIQPFHLTIAIVAIGIQFVIYLLLNKERVFRSLASPK